MSGDVGRPTLLDDTLCLKIRDLVLEGKELPEIAKICEIPYDTVEGWRTRNYNGFADRYRLYKTERRLKVAEEFGDRLMFMEEDDKDIIKLKQKEAEFVRETVGKMHYSKRTESDITSNGQTIGVELTPEQKKRIAQETLLSMEEEKPVVEVVETSELVEVVPTEEVQEPIVVLNP